MKIRNLLFLLPVILFSQCTAESSEENKEGGEEKTRVVLFDGTSTDHWKDIKSDNFPESGWLISDGILTVLANTEEQEGGYDII